MTLLIIFATISIFFSFLLLNAVIQFVKPIRLRFIKLHRLVGKTYVFLTLAIAAPSGLVMGYYANGGFYSQLSFCLLSILWFYFTLQAILSIKNKKVNFLALSLILSIFEGSLGWRLVGEMGGSFAVKNFSGFLYIGL